MSFVICSCKTGKYLNQIFLTESWPGIMWIKLCLSNFDSFPLACDPVLFPGKNIPNIAKSNHIFPRKERQDKDFILTCLDSSMAKVFPHYCLFFSISAIFRRKRGVKVGPKVLILGLFHKYSNPSKIFQTKFLFARAGLKRSIMFVHLVETMKQIFISPSRCLWKRYVNNGNYKTIRY